MGKDNKCWPEGQFQRLDGRIEVKPLSILSRIGGSHASHLVSPTELKHLADEIMQSGTMITAQHIKGKNLDVIEIKIMCNIRSAEQNAS